MRYSRRASKNVFILIMGAVALATGACCIMPWDHDKDGSEPEITIPDPPEIRSSTYSFMAYSDLWYFLNQHSALTFGAVQGGAQTSTVDPDGAGISLFDSDQYEMDWHFLLGKRLVVRPDAAGGNVITDIPGNAIRSTNSVVYTPDFGAAKWTTMKLLTLHDHDSTILHVPVLTGEGWPSVGGLATPAATLQEAEAVLNHLGLKWTTTGSGTQVVGQSPSGGQLTSPLSVVALSLGGSATTPTEGDTATSPIVIPSLGVTRVDLTPAHADDVNYGTHPHTECYGTGPDVFLKIPDSLRGIAILVSETSSERVVLSAWERDTRTGELAPVLDALGEPFHAKPVGTVPAYGGLSTHGYVAYEGTLAQFKFTPSTDTGVENLILVEHQKRNIASLRIELGLAPTGP